MAGLVHLVVLGKDALLAAVIVFQLGNFGRDTFQLEAGDVLNQTKRLRRSVALITVMSRNIHQVSPKRNALGEFQGHGRV
jgi:hypothetical protein